MRLSRFVIPIIIILAASGVIIFTQRSAPQGTACTLEAKLCPDGSYVGRNGPRCEFTKCPGEEETQKASGTIKGKVTVGPICPVERVGVPCPVPPEAYTSRALIVYQANDATVVASSQLNPDGTYSFTLPPGNYVLDIKRQGIDHASPLPHPFSLAKNETLTFDISIDTGIR